jgi:sterol desaturase/sphingolipid hydroxylase (fatty acid hydroxylase superfamily)/predicted lipoprotein
MFDTLLDPVEALFEPSKRVFAPFMLVAALMGALALAARGLGSREVARQLFDRRVWLHRSAMHDYQLIVIKAVLRAIAFGGFTLSTLAIAGVVCGWLRRHAGTSPIAHGALPLVAAAAIYTLLAFLVEDWSRFWVHRLMHRVPLLWDFHRVHHGAEVMTPFTLYRTHPVEALLNGVRGSIAIGLVTGASAWLLGPKVRGWEVLGVDAIGFVWSLLGANLRHSHVWLSYGPRLERFLLSPAQHQIHHSDDERHNDRNFGTVLSLWDWIGGSLYTTSREPEQLRYGVVGEPASPSPGVVEMLVGPFVGAARKVRPALAPAALAALVVALLAGCSSKHFDRAAMLAAMGDNTLAVYRSLAGDATTLVDATQAFAQTPNETTRKAAQQSWSTLMIDWQQAELLRYGPLAPVGTPGGLGLRDEIYSWPLVARCPIEEQIVAQGYQTITNLTVDLRGLAAMEYLLFFTDTTNQCGNSSAINAQGTWAALSADELTKRKAAYAYAAAVDVAARTASLVSAWENGFLGELKTAGHGSTLFVTQQIAIDTVAQALFYADTHLKDRKLGVPLGLVDCPVAGCSLAPESEWAGIGKQHLSWNVQGMRLLLEGAPPPAMPNATLGFDDYLEGVGAASIAAELRADDLAALAAIGALPDAPLAQTLANNPAALIAVYDSLKELTDLIKMDLTTTLQITAPTRVEGDHD